MNLQLLKTKIRHCKIALLFTESRLCTDFDVKWYYKEVFLLHYYMYCFAILLPKHGVFYVVQALKEMKLTFI